MSQFTEEQLKEVKRNLEGQVIINKEIIAAQVEAGWKKDVLAKHYELPVASITSILKTLGLKIRKFHKPAFVIDGLDSPAITAEAVETDSPTKEEEVTETPKEVSATKVEKTKKAPKAEKVKEEKVEEKVEETFEDSTDDSDFQTEDSKSDEEVQEEVAQEDNAGDWGDDSSEEEEWV